MAQDNGHAETSELPCARCGFDCVLSRSAFQKALSPPLFLCHGVCLSSPFPHRCGKAAKLQCPKCLEMQLPKQPSVFCSQECFKVRRQLSHLACPCGCRQRALRPGCAACPCCAAYWPVAVLQPSCSSARQSACLHVQQAWPEHKRAHKPGPESWLFCTQRGRARSTTMPEFRWTGPLRPTPIAPRRPVWGWSCLPEQCCLDVQLG